MATIKKIGFDEGTEWLEYERVGIDVARWTLESQR